MDIVINLDKIIAIFEMPADILLAKFFLYFGWMPFVFVLLWGIFKVWVYYRQNQYADRREFVLLAVDIPINNEQSPKAVENMFAHLAGAHSTNTLVEDYWEGKTQDSFSFEIVSIDGYTQMLMRGEKKHRDMMEAMVYAQYPDAEIAEVNDYTQGYPERFPDEKYEIWGGEWVATAPNPYPIKTYLDFEHQFTGEFKDPMAALMEVFSSLRPGEQCWYQIIVTPISKEWEQQGAFEISRVIGEKVKAQKNIIDKSFDFILKILSSFSEFIIPLWGEIEEKEADENEVNMMNLRPVQKKRIEAIQQKVSKIGFEVKIRFIYIAEKEIFNSKRANSFVGVIKQYSTRDLNELKPDMEITVTKTSYFWKASRLAARKNRIIRAYKSRSNWLGRLPFILNIEELASLWYFPVELAVKAPMLQKISSRKSEAPSFLPVEGSKSDLSSEIIGAPKAAEFAEEEEIFSNDANIKAGSAVRQSGPPENLPIG